MGVRLPNIPTDNSQIVYSGIDCSYFSAGLTPKFFFVSLWGICPGDLWYSTSFPYPPPCGIWKLTQIEANLWEYREPNKFFIQYLYYAELWNIYVCYILSGITKYVLMKRTPTIPYHSIENALTSKTGLFYNGLASIQWQPPTGPAAILDIANIASVPTGTKTFITPIPKNATESKYRFCRRIDGTNIKITVNKHT